MKKFVKMLFSFVLLFFLVCCDSDSSASGQEPSPTAKDYLSVSPDEITIQTDGKAVNVAVTSNRDWTVLSDADWCNFSQKSGTMGSYNILVSALSNSTKAVRSAELTFTAGTVTKKCKVTQKPTEIESFVPQGYSLVWQDEFDDAPLSGGKPALPNTTEWWYETGAGGWGNNELQTYIAGYQGSEQLAAIKDGSLTITAKKINGTVCSIRMNTKQSWKYGYFEARLQLPGGKGTWPAFWMMPKNFTAWPDDGEIDIMEYVGYEKDVTHSAIHTKSYNHSIGTQKEASKAIANMEAEYHVYALEWTEDYIRTYVDGKEIFTFSNDKAGNKNTWPFNAEFYIKLNLAWGGNWGGAQGIDESALPATYKIDYVRVFQKK
jgi:hypothetical protein